MQHQVLLRQPHKENNSNFEKDSITNKKFEQKLSFKRRFLKLINHDAALIVFFPQKTFSNGSNTKLVVKVLYSLEGVNLSYFEVSVIQFNYLLSK